MSNDGAFAAISSIVNNAATIKFNQEEAQKQREWNEQQMEKQNQWTLDQWNRENEYNSPSAQVQRLREAGLNPLYYGIDGIPAAGVQSASPLGYERAQMGNLVNPVTQSLQASLLRAQIENTQSDTAKKNNETLTETAKRDRYLADIEVVRQELNNKIASENLTIAQKNQIEKAISWTDRLNEAILAEKESSSKLNDSQRNRIDSLLEGEKLIQAKSITDFEYRWQKIQAEISKFSKETGLLEKDIENYALNHANNGFMSTGLSIPNFIRFIESLATTVDENGVVQPIEPMADMHARP